MRKFFSYFEKEKIVIMLVVIISLFPLYTPGFFYSHDGVIHLFRTTGVYTNMMNFDFFNTIYYNMINGFGYGWGIFYPPISAVVPGFFMFIGFSLFTAQKLFIIIISILAGLFSYKLFNELYKHKFCAMITAIIYVLAPFKMSQIFVRGAFGELLLFTFLPLVIFGLIKILNKEYNYKYYFIFGVSAIVYSHIISTIYTAIFVLIFLLLNVKLLKDKKMLLELVKIIGIILLICLPVLVPLAEHQITNIYNVNSMMGGDVANSILHVGQLIGGAIDVTAGNTNYFSNDKEMNFMIGLMPIIILILLPLLYEKIKKNGDKNNLIKYSILLFVAILMMTTPLLWNKIGFFDVIQFPWRLLTFGVFFISIISGYVVKAVLTEENKYSLLLVILTFSFVFIYMIGSQTRFAKYLNVEFDFKNQTLTQENNFGDISNSLGYSHEYLPKTLDVETLKNRGKGVLVSEGSADISDLNIKTDKLNANIQTNSQDTTLELPYIYYKGYNIKVDGKTTSYEISDTGFIKININGVGKHKISTNYTGTILYNSCNIVAIIVLVGSVFAIIKNRAKDV